MTSKPWKDSILMILVSLLTLTIAGFLTGYLPYPFGIVVLILFTIARILHLRNVKP